MEPVFEKLKDMLYAYYPTIYLQTYEYDRTWMKIRSIANSIISSGTDVNLYKWNCVEGLLEVSPEEKTIKIDDEPVLEPSMVLKYIHSIKDKSHKDIFVLEDFNAYKIGRAHV